MTERRWLLEAGDITNVHGLYGCRGKRLERRYRFGPTRTKHHEHLVIWAECTADCGGGIVG